MFSKFITLLNRARARVRTCQNKEKSARELEKEYEEEKRAYLPHGRCLTPRYTDEHCFFVFVVFVACLL